MAYPFYQGYQPYQNMNNMYTPAQNNNMYTQVQNSQDERIFVQGRLAAEAYLVAPNSFVRLWDSTENKFYEKRADQSGRPYMETYEYRRCESQQPTQQVNNTSNTVDYTSMINALEKRIEAIEGGLRNESKSYVNDTAVHAVQTAVPRRSEARGHEADAVRKA